MANALADFLGGYQAGNEITQQQRQQRQQNQLTQLAPQIVAGDPQAYAQAAAINPQAAQQYQAGGDEIARRARGAAKFLQSALQSGNQQQIMAARQTIKPFMDTLKPGSSYPLDLDPQQEMAGIQGFLAQTSYLDPTMNGQGQVQSTYVDAQGNRVAIMRNGSTQILGQDNPKVQIIDTGDGFYGVNKGTLQAAPVSTRGGSTASAMPTEADMNADAQIANEMIAAGIPEAQVDAFLTARGQRASSMQQPAADNQLRKAPAAVTPYQQAQLGMDQQRLRLQEEANARAQAQADRNNSPGAKPLPLTAQKTAFDLQDQVQNASNVISMAQKHLDRLNSGQLDVSRGAQAAGWLRSTTGLNDENSINLAELDSDKTQIVNESLRLNKGVQTEGDAQRAAREIMAANDSASLKRSLERMQAINQRAAQLKQQQLSQLYTNYGRGSDGEPIEASSAPQSVPASPQRSGGVDDLLSKYGVR
ncbi:hypothetical protein ACQHIH_15970 [Xanthomonas sontii]|uniref:hypothetical protein n=1 Tax=Xanthomonas sontii TaxID=2650745 RepID=UPI003F82E900